MQTASSMIWTWVTRSISHEDNHYTTKASTDNYYTTNASNDNYYTIKASTDNYYTTKASNDNYYTTNASTDNYYTMNENKTICIYSSNNLCLKQDMTQGQFLSWFGLIWFGFMVYQPL